MEPESLLIFWVILVIFVYLIATCYTEPYLAVVLALSTGFILIIPFIRVGFDRVKYNSKFYDFIRDTFEVIFIISLFIMYFYISRSTLYTGRIETLI